jgi:uroporphyrin-III C-methyltransferase/precorrin-2 dehydrogenase/sirohydrochlorin ferrochelatase
MTYPVHLELEGARVLVVGAGAVASRRIAALLAEGADVIVVAPAADPRVEAWATADEVTLRERPFAHSDVIGARLVLAATDDPEVNRVVAEESARRGIWCIRADDAVATRVRTPAVARAGEVTVSVTSGDPRRSTAIRSLIASGLADGSLIPGSRSGGRVTLVGAGPGDPDLITVRGRRALQSAEVVVHDRLSSPALLALAPPAARLVDAGKAPARHTMTQDQINATLVREARAGHHVVRLKGGDPYVLGRGSEEVVACSSAGVPVEVVPGISSALWGPGSAGIPVTHRGTSTGFIVISGHEVGDLHHVARSGLTVVVLMGMAHLPAIAEAFLAAGRSATTPVAVVHRAATPHERSLRSTLDRVVADVAAVGLTNPAVIVIGDVVDALAAAVSEQAS